MSLSACQNVWLCCSVYVLCCSLNGCTVAVYACWQCAYLRKFCRIPRIYFELKRYFFNTKGKAFLMGIHPNTVFTVHFSKYYLLFLIRKALSGFLMPASVRLPTWVYRRVIGMSRCVPANPQSVWQRFVHPYFG